MFQKCQNFHRNDEILQVKSEKKYIYTYINLTTENRKNIFNRHCPKKSILRQIHFKIDLVKHKKFEAQ